MQTKHKLFLLLASILISCKAFNQKEPNANSENTIQNSRIYTERYRGTSSYSSEKLAIADFIDDYLNIMFDSSLQTRNNHWHSSILTHAQDYFLKSGFQRDFLVHYPPKLLGIRKLENNQFIATIDYSENNFSLKIMNLKLAIDGLGRPYFIDILGENLEDFQTSQLGQCTFYYSPSSNRDKTKEQQLNQFNRQMAELFNTNLKTVKVIVLKDIKDYCNTLGYVYSPILTYDGQTGGIAIPNENIILNANNSAYYPHELVHLYTGDLDTHSWFDEGLATYLGGSVEYPLSHHLKKVAKQMDTLNFSQLPKDQKLDDDTNIKYTLGGLFCKLAYEKHGREALFRLLESGRSEEDFHQALKDVFNLSPQDYDAFIRSELNVYAS